MNGAALVFPGQGAQHPGMGKDLCRDFDVARETFAMASEAVGFDLSELCFDGPADKLELTRYTQPAVFTVDLASWRVLSSETGISPIVAAGHSLGEYAALAAAGALSISDAAGAVAHRGEWMEEAVPAGVGGMAAALGAERDLVERACKEASIEEETVVPANDNAPGQIVISGHARALERAMAIIKEGGGKVRKLKVSGPFHTELMRPAADKMRKLLDGMAVAGFDFPVIANAGAKEYPGPGSVAELLVRQVVSAVDWRQSVMEMDKRGADIYIEAGPGSVLAGLIKRILPGATVLPMSEPAHVAAIEKAVAHAG